MRLSFAVGASVALSVGFVAVATLRAQRPVAPTGSQTGVALLDMASISQNSVRFKQSIDTLKKEYDAKAQALKQEGDTGNQLTEKVRSMPAGSPERKKLEQEVLKMRADFELHGKRINDDTRERTMKNMYLLLREVQDEVARYAVANNVQLVLRYDPPPAEMTDPRAIFQEVQKPIVYQRAFDATPPILEALNRRGPSGAGRTAGQTKPLQR